MQLTATLAEESLEALAHRVYDLGDKPSQSGVRAATRALADANPVLRRMADVPPGTVIDVPPLASTEPRAGVTLTEDAAAASLVRAQVAAAAALIGRQLAADLDEERAEAEETLKLARAPELKRAKAPGLEDALPRAVAAAESRVEAVKEVRSRRDAVLRQLAEDLRDFTGAHVGSDDDQGAGAGRNRG